MGVEVVGFETVQAPDETFTVGGNSVLHSKENGKLDHAPALNEPIKFGTHVDEPVKNEANNVTANNVPRDAVDEWPAPKQIHAFYFIRYRPYDDPNIKAKIDQAEKEMQKRNQSRFQITEALKAKRSERAELISQLKSLRDDNRQFRSLVDEKIKEIEPLQQALGKLRNANNAGRAGGLCSSEEELNGLIQSMQYRIQHESITLAEEKQILREIKQLEGTREKVVANAAMRAKLQDTFNQKEAIQDQVKIIGGDLDGVRKEQQAVRAKIKQLDDAMKEVDNNIKSLQDDLAAVTEKREKSYEGIQQLRKKSNEGNSYFYQCRSMMNKARELAARKDVKGLEELAHAEVEKFMSLWNGDKVFRDDYEKRILLSLDIRQLSRDGRIRNADEKPLVAVEEPAETEPLPKAPSKQTKEDPKPAAKQAKEDPKPPSSEAQKIQKQAKKAAEPKTVLEHVDKADEEIPVLEKPAKETSSKDKELDEAKLKEMKREEETVKAKQAIERKKKLAEKAAVRAAIRVQKEAEKKLKEQEKKAKKKAAASVPATASEEPAEVDEPSEPEKVNEAAGTPAPANEKVQKANTVRSRNRTTGQDAIRKVVLKRKKGTNYWMWAAPAAAVVLVLLVLGYNYLL